MPILFNPCSPCCSDPNDRINDPYYLACGYNVKVTLDWDDQGEDDVVLVLVNHTDQAKTRIVQSGTPPFVIDINLTGINLFGAYYYQTGNGFDPITPTVGKIEITSLGDKIYVDRQRVDPYATRTITPIEYGGHNTGLTYLKLDHQIIRVGCLKTPLLCCPTDHKDQLEIFVRPDRDYTQWAPGSSFIPDEADRLFLTWDPDVFAWILRTDDELFIITCVSKTILEDELPAPPVDYASFTYTLSVMDIQVSAGLITRVNLTNNNGVVDTDTLSCSRKDNSPSTPYPIHDGNCTFFDYLTNCDRQYLDFTIAKTHPCLGARSTPLPRTLYLTYANVLSSCLCVQGVSGSPSTTFSIGITTLEDNVCDYRGELSGPNLLTDCYVTSGLGATLAPIIKIEAVLRTCAFPFDPTYVCQPTLLLVVYWGTGNTFYELKATEVQLDPLVIVFDVVSTPTTSLNFHAAQHCQNALDTTFQIVVTE